MRVASFLSVFYVKLLATHMAVQRGDLEYVVSNKPRTCFGIIVRLTSESYTSFNQQENSK